MSDSSNAMDCSLPGSSVHGVFQARVLGWVAISFSIFYFFIGISCFTMFLLYSKMSQLYIYVCVHIYISSLLDLRMMWIFFFSNLFVFVCPGSSLLGGFCLVAESRG